MPNQRNAIFMDSSMPNSAKNAGRKAVMGMERMGAATGLTKSCTHRKLPISRPNGMAMTTQNVKACAMRHQLLNTLPSRSYSVQSRTNARITPRGLGRENGGRISQCVSANQTARMPAQAATARISRVRREISLRIVKRSSMQSVSRDPAGSRPAPQTYAPGVGYTLMSVGRFFSRPSGVELSASGRSGPLPAVRIRVAGNPYLSMRYCLTASARSRESSTLRARAPLASVLPSMSTTVFSDLTHTRGGESILIHEILLDRLGPLPGKLHVARARAAGIGVAVDVHHRVFVGFEESADLVHHGARVETHPGRIRVEINRAALRGDGRGSLGRLLVFGGRLRRGHREFPVQLVDEAAVDTGLGIEGVLDDAILVVHLLGHFEDVGVVGIGAARAEEGLVIRIVGQSHATQHRLGKIFGNVEILDGADQGVRAIGLRLDELDP